MITQNQMKLMKEAFKEARKADFHVYPNPFVGALIVKNEKIISKGYHSYAGGPHAEILAIEVAKDKVENSDLYVTLEPCSTYGKTPPCTKKIIESKIKRVFFGAYDINPQNNNKAKKILEDNGIEVIFLDFQKENDDLNKVFINSFKSKLPYVSLKTAISLDGMITDSFGTSKWITSLESRKKVHKIRKKCDCILIGGNTFNKDNPKLDSTSLKKSLSPSVIIISSSGKLNFKNDLFNAKSLKPIYILTSQEGYLFLNNNINNSNVKIIKMSLLKNGNISILSILKFLKKYGFSHVLVEGGAKIMSSFLKENFYNELNVFIAPKIFGANSKSFSGQNTLFSVNHKSYLNLIEYKKISNDIYLRYKNVHRNY